MMGDEENGVANGDVPVIELIIKVSKSFSKLAAYLHLVVSPNPVHHRFRTYNRQDKDYTITP